jgi:hypothetical protein
MPVQPEAKLARLNAFRAMREERVLSSILNRWGNADWDVRFPWWREPSEVRILMYADDQMDFSDLRYVRTLLESQPYPFVRFKITTAHRDQAQDPNRNIDRGPVALTVLNIVDNFDEIWLFGSRETKEPENEVAPLVEQFMAEKGGGVLVTGDHRALGGDLAERIDRVGEMRLWTIPVLGPDRHSSLVEGPDPNTSFDGQDEADDRPQIIHYRRFPVGAPAGVTLQPHPVLSGPDGPIDVLPDHQHEGQAVTPDVLPAAKWPINAQNNHQEQPFVIAWGDVKDPQVHFKQFGVISAYNGHTVDVGRIVADSSWHHWLNSNLIGNGQTNLGFHASPEGEAALKKIDAYFLNCATWLAPPQKQIEIRNAAWWATVWADETVEVPADAPLTYFGDRATKVLRRFASSSAVSEWVLGPDIFNNALSDSSVAQIAEGSSLLNLDLEQFLAGGILRALMREVGSLTPELNFPTEAPPDERLEQAITVGTADALASINNHVENEVVRFRNAIASFRFD